MSSLDVHLNRDRPRSLEAPERFSTRRPFEVYLENHGDGSHVHVSLDDALSRVATVRDGTEFLPAGEITRIHVDTADVDAPVSGVLTVSIAYGATTAEVLVTVSPEQEGSRSVDVDESLSTPQGRPRPSSSPGLERTQTAALLGLAGFAIVIAVGAAIAVGGTVVNAGAAVVVVAALVAAGLVLRAS